MADTPPTTDPAVVTLPGPALPTAPAQPAVPPPAPDPNAGVTALLLQQLTAAQRRAAELEEAERVRQAAAARAEQDLLAEKGNSEAARQALAAAREAHERELSAERARRAEVEGRARTSFRDRELATALAGKQLVPGAAPQLIRLLRDALDAHPEGDGYSVRTADFVSVTDYVGRELAKPEYAHFQLPTSTGGAGATGGSQTAPTPAPNGAPVDRLAESLKRVVQAQQSEAPGLAGTYGRN